MKKLAIVGSHPKTRDLAPLNNPDYDIWVFNESVSLGWAKTATAVFQMHNPIIFRNPANRNDPKHYQWLVQPQGKIEIFMQEKFEDVPNSVKYPMDQILAMLGTLQRGEDAVKYFTSSVAYALALGIYRNYKHIEVWGVELETNTEYQYQRENLNYWCGVAIGRGIDLIIPKESGLFRDLLYGFEGDLEVPADLLETRKVTKEKERGIFRDAFKAAIESVRIRMEQLNQTMTPDEANKAAQAYADSVGHAVQAAFDLGSSDGAVQEIERYISKSDIMREATGGALFSRQEFEQAAAQIGIERDKAQAVANWKGGEQRILFDVIGTTTASDLETRRKLGEKYAKKLNEYIDAYIRFGQYQGAGKENMLLLDWYDQRLKAAGGAKSEAVFLAQAGGA
jgi:hypothetical protein